MPVNLTAGQWVNYNPVNWVIKTVAVNRDEKARDAKVVLCVSQSNMSHTIETDLTYLTRPNVEKISVVKLFKATVQILNV